MTKYIEDKPIARERIFFPDMMRLLSFFAIVLFHFNVNIFQSYPNSMQIGSLSYLGQTMGDIGISIFIIISGLSLSFSASKSFSVTNFFKKRFLAIYPSFWIAYILVGVVYFFVVGHFVGDGKYWKIILSITGLDGFFLYRMQNYYLVGEWYTGYMIITYLFFPLLFLGFRKSALVTWFSVMLIFFIVAMNYNNIFRVYINCNPITRLPDFLFGITYGLLILNNKKRRFLMFLVGIAVLLFIVNNKNIFMPQLYMFIFGASFFSASAYICEFFKNIPVFSGAISYLARHSFMAFLFHHQILYMMFSVVYYPDLTVMQSYMFLIAIVILSLGAAIITEPLVNKFTEFLRRKIY